MIYRSEKKFKSYIKSLECVHKLLESLKITPSKAKNYSIFLSEDGRKRSASELLGYPTIGLNKLKEIWAEIGSFEQKILHQASIECKYKEHIIKQKGHVAAYRRDLKVKIPKTIDYKKSSDVNIDDNLKELDYLMLDCFNHDKDIIGEGYDIIAYSSVFLRFFSSSAINHASIIGIENLSYEFFLIFFNLSKAELFFFLFISPTTNAIKMFEFSILSEVSSFSIFFPNRIQLSISPSKRYKVTVAKDNLTPYVIPIKKITNVCIVIGTGQNGT